MMTMDLLKNRRIYIVALLTKEIFDNPYVDLGGDRDICALCRKEYSKEHPDEYDYKIDELFYGKLRDKKIFKLFKNSNTPLVLCADHLKKIADSLQEEN